MIFLYFRRNRKQNFERRGGAASQSAAVRTTSPRNFGNAQPAFARQNAVLQNPRRTKYRAGKTTKQLNSAVGGILPGRFTSVETIKYKVIIVTVCIDC